MFNKLTEQLQKDPKTIVFTEGPDARILEAADKLLKDKILNVILVGEKAEVEEKATKTVVMKAFTGMWIGEFEIIKETKKTITVATKKGELKFDKATGIQLDANNPKFANHIELA